MRSLSGSGASLSVSAFNDHVFSSGSASDWVTLSSKVAWEADNDFQKSSTLTDSFLRATNAFGFGGGGISSEGPAAGAGGNSVGAPARASSERSSGAPQTMVPTERSTIGFGSMGFVVHKLSSLTFKRCKFRGGSVLLGDAGTLAACSLGGVSGRSAFSAQSAALSSLKRGRKPCVSRGSSVPSNSGSGKSKVAARKEALAPVGEEAAERASSAARSSSWSLSSAAIGSSSSDSSASGTSSSYSSSSTDSSSSSLVSTTTSSSSSEYTMTSGGSPRM
mmetsp:Transcript_46923/g.134148  ORF Transcript_46923/g.134148 Transcript_46923/m.134148 type:complete len:277 (+) Transcript_46923:224-1054(+)